jgi:hypothetical protein
MAIRHIWHASIGIDNVTCEYDISEVTGSTAPEVCAYLVRIARDIIRRQVVLMVYCGLPGAVD